MSAACVPQAPSSSPVMDRRTFLAMLPGSLLAAPLAAEAQPLPGSVRRLGVLLPTPVGPSEPAGALFHLSAALHELGYVEGRNLVIERRWAEGKVDRLPCLARELVQLKVDAIVAVSHAAIRSARDATTTIPIVMFTGLSPDPVAAGFVASLARPGGNITGVLIAAEETLAGKRLELIKEAVPRSTRIGLLSPADAGSRIQVQEAEKAASSLGVKLIVVEVQRDEFDRAFARLAAERPAALLVAASPFFFRGMTRIIALAAKHRLPAIYEWREHVTEGGLMAYGSSLAERSRRAAAYVDRIFKGANPGDLPIEQPIKFELVINLKTAKALGLTIPPSLLLRADQVIE
jgi:putative tryptophan/tyrosine transport system substrate-binding protein